jgi:ABC-2 type transport system permease protein
MIMDLFTVMQKELREFFAPGGSRRGGLIGILIIIVVFGVFIPLENGRDWVTSPFTVAFYGVYLPLSLVTNVIADAIAGERERHTLETLLASRLSDRSILLGKLSAAVVYTWALSMGTAVVGMVVANSKGHGGFAFYPGGVALAMAVLAVLVALLYAGIGVQISLRAATVRQAQQTLGFAFLIVFLLPFIIFTLLSTQQKRQFIQWLTTANWTQVGIGASVVLLILDVVLVAIALARFQRSRLILS